MPTPTQKLEKKLHKKGYRYIAGIDEVGRGSVAGPLVAAAVILPNNFKIKGLKDSKALSQTAREKFFLIITKKALSWSVGKVSERVIDHLGILAANKLAFTRAIKKLAIKPDYLIFDGVRILQPKTPHEFVIAGDTKIYSVAAASIIAKVVRDMIMVRYHQDDPKYKFHQHKGYGTKNHLNIVKKNGPSTYHRLSFLSHL